MQDSKELILVYNADSGFFSLVKDGLHKIISPSTYQCSLCALTYGNVIMKKEWKEYIDQLELPSKFLHRDEFKRELESHPHNLNHIKYPAIFIRSEEKIFLLVTSEEINKLKSLEDLMNLIDEKLLEQIN
jgi:predicted nuclease with TOPRIM domain